MRQPFYLLLMTAIALLSACSGTEDGPEARIRALVADIEQTAEQGKALGFKDYVSEDYSDSEGRGQREVLRLVAGYKLRNRSIHLLVHIAEVKVAEDQNSGSARVFAAIAGSPLTGVDQLAALQADLYRFDLQLRAGPDGVFKVIGAEWQPAEREDFLSE